MTGNAGQQTPTTEQTGIFTNFLGPFSSAPQTSIPGSGGGTGTLDWHELGRPLQHESLTPEDEQRKMFDFTQREEVVVVVVMLLLLLQQNACLFPRTWAISAPQDKLNLGVESRPRSLL